METRLAILQPSVSIRKMMDKCREPAVPPDLTAYTCGPVDFEDFLQSGAEVYTQLNLASRRYSGREMRQFADILDFGCGCGRILRFMAAESPSAHGCDVNAKAAAYTGLSVPAARVYQNLLMPPLDYESGRFDLVYSFSVFSHLSREVENAWLGELVRIGKPGCLYLLSVHGDWVIEATLGAEADVAREAGFHFRKVHSRSGTELDFPEYYEASYHTSDYIRRAWSPYLEIVDIIKGDNPSRYLWGDLQFEPIGTVPAFRPMGQDLVVARKRASH
jgi:SAM-dependent methyltransferase